MELKGVENKELQGIENMELKGTDNGVTRNR